ncbi:MAG: hypothetical protein QW407_03975 [Thermofilaceae archaeon]
MASPDACKIVVVTRVWKLYDPDGTIARTLERGGSVEEFRDRILEVREVRGNLFLNEGINFIWLAVTGASGLTPFNAANARIGVGDGTAPVSPTQTGLQGENKYYKGMDSGYPQVVGTSVKFRSTFGPGEAEFAWNEWTVANGPSDDAVNLNRRVESLGVKGPNTTMTIEVTLTIT